MKIKIEKGTVEYEMFLIYSLAIKFLLEKIRPLYRYKSTVVPINIIYGNPARLWARYNLLPNNERIDLPIITYNLNSFQERNEYNIPPHLFFLKEFYLPNGKLDILRSYYYNKIKTYNIMYKIDIFTEFKIDMDFILYSLLRFFDNNNFCHIIYDPENTSNLDIKTPFYIPLKLSTERTLEVSYDEKEKNYNVSCSLDLSIPNAYVPTHPIKTAENLVFLAKNIDIKIEHTINMASSQSQLEEKEEEKDKIKDEDDKYIIIETDRFQLIENG